MYYVELKKFKFLFLIILLFFTFSFLSFSVRAEEEIVLLPDNEQAVNNDFSEGDIPEKYIIVKRKSGIEKESSNENTTFNELVIKVSLIIFAVLVFLALIKILLSKNQSTSSNDLIGELAQKFTRSFSGSLQDLKLKQILTLTPGQNLYVIEIDGKRLLVGGTQQGGVQFLADLTQEELKNEKLDFKQIEEYKVNDKPFPEMDFFNAKSAKLVEIPSNVVAESPFMEQEIASNKNTEIKRSIVHDNRQGFKRRISLKKKVLFNENINNAEGLLRVK